MENQESYKDEYLECEKKWVFAMLMGVAGFFGAFTYTLRGGIFCNAQTANFVLLGMAVGNKEWMDAAYLIIPITAYFLGAFISEAIAGPIKKWNIIRWDTLLIIIEMIVVVLLGFVPESAPYQISQIAINFICSMQYNTFRQAQGIPMATTFCTNHLRQVGVACAKLIKHRENTFSAKALFHSGMLFVFVLGATISAALCNAVKGKAIWFTLIPLGIVLIDLLKADFKSDAAEFERIPRGH